MIHLVTNPTTVDSTTKEAMAGVLVQLPRVTTRYRLIFETRLLYVLSPHRGIEMAKHGLQPLTCPIRLMERNGNFTSMAIVLKR